MSVTEAGRRPRWGWGRRILIVAALSVIAVYFLATPAGLLDKAARFFVERNSTRN